MRTDYDAIILGGGMTGTSLACALSGHALRLAVLEAGEPDTPDDSGNDDRGIALSISSKRIYESIALWPLLAGQLNPIEHIHISEQGRFAKVRFSATEQGMEALGYVVIARALGNALLTRARQLPDVDFLSRATCTAIMRLTDHIAVTCSQAGQARHITARLLLVADGANSASRSRLGIRTEVSDYRQRAFITSVTPEKPHNNTAFERFTPEGSLALLPAGRQRCVAVHVVADELAAMLEQLPKEQLLGQIQQRFGKRLGRFGEPGAVRTYPLALVLPDTQIQERAVLLGNAAHTLHPNAAQGFNLCLRDIAELADTLISEHKQGRDIGGFHVLQHYYRRRRQDQQRIIRFTRQLNTLFYSDHPLKRLARHSVMLAIDAVPLLKHHVIQQATGLAGIQPAVISRRMIN